jgi:hypothetical protein
MLYKTLSGLFIALLFFASCEKPAGEGGNASIRGRVLVKDYNASFTVFIREYFAQDQRVYIIYGEDQVYSDDFRTDYDGWYEFRFLRPGRYTLYTYSKDSTLQSPTQQIPVFAEVTIPSGETLVTVPDLVIFE